MTTTPHDAHSGDSLPSVVDGRPEVGTDGHLDNFNPSERLWAQPAWVSAENE